MTKDVVELDL